MGLSFEKPSLRKKHLGHSEHSLICAACKKTKSHTKQVRKCFTKWKLSPKRLRQELLGERYCLLTSSQPFANITLRFCSFVFKPEFYILLHKWSQRACKVVREHQPNSSSAGVCFSRLSCCLVTSRRGGKNASSYVQDNASSLTDSAAAFEALMKYCTGTQMVGGR